MPLSLNNFEAELYRISFYRGRPYGRVQLLFDFEKDYGHSASKFKGHLALSDALKAFFLETTENSNSIPFEDNAISPSGYFPLFIGNLVCAFQSLCGSERIAVQGYPLQGYQLLRNTYDNLQILSAILQGYSDFHKAAGICEGQPICKKTLKGNRKKEENTIREHMVGNKSKLTSTTITELKEWDELFDIETHGARISLARGAEWINGNAPLHILPQFDMKSWALFMNRFSEICWMFHRLIPAMQPAGYDFSGEWREKWGIIDEAFRLTVSALSTELGKPIGHAIAEYVNNKFPFGPNYHFPL